MTIRYALAFVCALGASAPAWGGSRHRERDEPKGGALSQVVGGLRSKSSSPSHSSAPARRRDFRDDDSSGGDDDGDTDAGSDWELENDTESFAAVGLALGVRAPSGRTDVDFTTGFQAVSNSGGSFGAQGRASYRHFTVSVASRAYMETLSDGDTLVLTTWRGTVGYRFTAPGRGALTLDVGPAGASSTGLSLVGMAAGITAHAAAADLVAVDGAIRTYAYSNDASAVELAAGARLSILRVGYRLLRFNVGPALHGPEVGVALSF